MAAGTHTTRGVTACPREAPASMSLYPGGCAVIVQSTGLSGFATYWQHVEEEV